VEVLVDVRQNPFSRKHGFSKKSLKKYTQKVGIQYLHLPELGVPSRLRKDLNSADSYKNLFEHYALNILPEKQKEVEKIKNMLIQQQRLALTCFEADPNMCHRHTVAEFIESDPKLGTPLKHI
ncbi:MAG: DUF488 domain-containing protein, partial [Chloroflexi bacterium]|nr:DUF488 domain-containing protein [Chloroflexota bacterium]